LCNAETSCQFRRDGEDPTHKQVTKKVPLNPYLSRMGLACVNCDLWVSPKVKITTLFGCDVPIGVVGCAAEKSEDKKTLKMSSAQIYKKIAFDLNIVVMFRYSLTWSS